jgi:hypothetical protein
MPGVRPSNDHSGSASGQHPPGVKLQRQAMKVLKVSLRPPDGRVLRAFIDLMIDPPGLIIRGFRVVSTRSGRLQIVYPQLSIKERGKAPYFKTLITLPAEMKRTVDKLVLGAYQDALGRSKEEKEDGRRTNAESENLN